MIPRLFDGTLESLTRGLIHAARRHLVVTENLANLNTPGYKSRDLAFADHLSVALSGTAPGGALPPAGDDGARARLVLAQDGPPRSDGNDVHLDHQMARLSENALWQQALSQVLAGQFAALKRAISGRV
jgi:flagellar basal-body rod protein FlgB